MAFGPQPSLDPQKAAQLVAALKKQSPPPNPAGASEKDNSMARILDYQRIRVAIERAQENETDPGMNAVFSSMHQAIIMRLQGMDSQMVKNALAQSSAPNPLAAAPPAMGAPAGMQAPPMPGGPPTGLGG